MCNNKVAVGPAASWSHTDMTGNGKPGELLALYNPVPTNPELCSLHLKKKTNKKKTQNENKNVFVS